MARVLLIVPPLCPEELFIRGAVTTASQLPSLGGSSIVAYLRQHGHEPEIYDGIAEPRPLEAVVDRIKACDLAGLMSFDGNKPVASGRRALIDRSKTCFPGSRSGVGRTPEGSHLG